MKPALCNDDMTIAMERPRFQKLTGYTRIKFTSEQINDIIDRYKKGESCYKIGKMYDVDSDTIRRRLLINGINTRNLPDSNILQGKVKICVICRTPFKFKNNDTRRQKTCSNNCLAILKSQNIMRENHPQWKGGVARYQEIAFIDFNKEKKCEKCGSSTDIVVHHIDQDHHNSSFENLQILCRSCHTKTHWEIRRREHETSIV